MRKAFVASVTVALLLVTGCGGGTGDSPSSTVITSDSSDILTRPLEADLSPRGVLLAAVILAGGDIAEALASGRVTVPEVEAAREAIAAGNLDFWRQRAESGN